MRLFRVGPPGRERPAVQAGEDAVFDLSSLTDDLTGRFLADDGKWLRLRSFVNGEARQDSSTADMIFPVRQLVWDLSQYLVLDPGDVINTGTPQGVALSGRFPYLADGDVIDLDIEHLGAQRQVVVPARQHATVR